MRLVGAMLVVSSLLLLVPSPARAEEDVQDRLKRAEKQNEQLKEDLGKQKAEAEAAFKAATDAENAAGLRGLSSSSVPETYPASGAVDVKLRLKRGKWNNKATFQPPNVVKGFRVYAGNCQVTKS